MILELLFLMLLLFIDMSSVDRYNFLFYFNNVEIKFNK